MEKTLTGAAIENSKSQSLDANAVTGLDTTAEVTDGQGQSETAPG
jgi:hypothetical protein